MSVHFLKHRHFLHMEHPLDTLLYSLLIISIAVPAVLFLLTVAGFIVYWFARWFF